jgi:YVTN family beta-propeller protein
MSVGPSTESLVGSELAGYRIEALIGRGGMGAVYRAQEAGLERKVALKVIAPELAQDARFRDRFLRESQIAASLDHPHVIPILKAGEEDGLLYLAMRYVEGTDLARLLAEEGALEPRRAVQLLEQVAEALDAAHERGLVHRDVKPSNVLIAEAAGREHCYLADFGLTKRTGSLSGVTAVGEVVGTLEYVAPEQITGGELDERSDVYSLGCVLYECLTGQPPLAKATDVALLWAHVHEEPQPPSKLRRELPRELDAVCTRALAKEPGRRYRSAGELAAAARSALGLGEAPEAPRRTKLLVGVGVVTAAALAVIAVALVVVFRSGNGGLSAISPNAVGVIDPETNELVAEVPVGARPGAVAVRDDSVWVANLDDETVSRIDPETREVLRTIPVGDSPSDIAVGHGSVWVALGPLAELKRINTERNTAARPILALEGKGCGPRASIALGAGAVWFVCGEQNVDLGRVDLRTGKAARIGYDAGLLRSGSSVAPEFSDVAYGLGSLWIVDRAANAVIEVDPATRQKLRPITVGRAPAAIAVDRPAGPGSLWVANFEGDSVTRIAIAGRGQGPVTTEIPVGDGPVDIAVGEDGVWVANGLDGTVTRLDPRTGETVATIEVGDGLQRLAVGPGAVWATVQAPDAGGASG